MRYSTFWSFFSHFRQFFGVFHIKSSSKRGDSLLEGFLSLPICGSLNLYVSIHGSRAGGVLTFLKIGYKTGKSKFFFYVKSYGVVWTCVPVDIFFP